MPQELQIALIAAGAALAGTLFGSFLTRTTEHKQWLRNKKVEVYEDFMTEMQVFEGMVRDDDVSLDALVRYHAEPRYIAIGRRLRLYGAHTVYFEGRQLERLQFNYGSVRRGKEIDTTYKDFKSADDLYMDIWRTRHKLQRKMRKDLSISTHDYKIKDVARGLWNVKRGLRAEKKMMEQDSER